MSDDIKDFFACDVEMHLNENHCDYHAYMELETAFHQALDEPFLSFFTKRDGVGKEETGTEVWLDLDSVQNLIGELAQWALKHGASLADIADLVGLTIEEEENNFSEDGDMGFTYGYSEEYHECPFCGSDDVRQYTQEGWEGTAIWCESCGGVLSDIQES